MLTTNPKQANKCMMQVNAGYWASQWGIKLQAGPFKFDGFEYQREPMQSHARRICYMKSAQSFGATEMEVLKDLHGMIMGKYKLGVAHIFPTNDEVGEFSKSRFKPLIANNKASIGKYVKNVSGGTDTTSLKKVRDAFLFLRGARLSQKVGDSTESTSSKTAGFSVDKCVFDEVDYMDTDVIEKYKGRMGQSPYREEVYLGNPSHEDFGIDLIHKQSDQRHWFRKCSCGHWTCAEESFPQCVKLRKDGTGYIGCEKCGKEVPMWAGEGTGEWVIKYPEKSSFMHGYMASQLICAHIDPAEILSDFNSPPLGNLADVYRLRLGRPYSNRDEKLRKSDVLANCGGDSPSFSHTGPCAMGVDVGKKYHAVVIGIKTGEDRYEILRTVKAEGFQEVRDLARRYNVKSDVVDIGPYYESAHEYQKASGHKTFLCEYSDTQSIDQKFNETTGEVKVNKTAIFDRSHRLLTRGNIRLACQCPETEEFARQCCNCAKFEEKDKRKGTMTFRYRKTGDRQDDFRSALNYFVLACSGHRVGVVSNIKHKHIQRSIMNTTEIKGKANDT